jgi:hypothetical protein
MLHLREATTTVVFNPQRLALVRVKPFDKLWCGEHHDDLELFCVHGCLVPDKGLQRSISKQRLALANDGRDHLSITLGVDACRQRCTPSATALNIIFVRLMDRPVDPMHVYLTPC